MFTCVIDAPSSNTMERNMLTQPSLIVSTPMEGQTNNNNQGTTNPDNMAVYSNGLRPNPSNKFT